MKKLFEIPVYALDRKTLDSRVAKRISRLEKLFVNAEPDLRAIAIDREVFPMRSWDYNHLVGFIRIGITQQDVLFDVFLSIPLPKRYAWYTTKKLHIQNINANGTHIYLGSLKTNAEIRDAVDTMLTQVVTDHIPSRFYVVREAFDAVNKHLDYLSVLQVE